MQCKPVIQLKDGKQIARFEGLSEAGRMLGIKSTSIGRCCNSQRKTYKGFNWKFE